MGVGGRQRIGEQRIELTRHPVLNRVRTPERKREAVALELAGGIAGATAPALVHDRLAQERSLGGETARLRRQLAYDRGDPLAVAQGGSDFVRSRSRSQAELGRDHPAMRGRRRGEQLGDAPRAQAARRIGAETSSSGSSTV